MWSTLESLFVAIAITVLKGAIKNPGSVAKEKTVIASIAAAATEADTAVNGTVWSSTPGTPTV